MSETSGVPHTAGPWTTRNDVFRVGDIDVFAGEPRYPPASHIARVNCRGKHDEYSGPSRERALANARLIAAAPELLEAAKNLDRLYHDTEWRISEEQRFSEATGGNYTALEHYHDELNGAIRKAEGYR